MNQELADLIADWRKFLGLHLAWRAELSRYLKAMRPIEAQLDKQMQERDRLRAEGRQAEVLASWENSAALMEQVAGPYPAYPDGFDLKKRAQKLRTWWEDFPPQTPAEREQRYNILRTLDVLFACYANVVLLGRHYSEGIDPAELPWESEDINTNNSQVDSQLNAQDIQALYKRKMEELYSEQPENWGILSIYYNACIEERKNKELAKQFEVTERTISRRIDEGEEYATQELRLPPLSRPRNRQKKHGR